MIKADEYFIKNIKEVIDNGTWDENPRPKWEDGTPAHSKFISQVFEEYDISKGEFPIPTLRNTAIKTGIKEIFWIYQAQSNSLDVAEQMNIGWWNEWDIGDRTIGNRYGYTVQKYDLINNLLKSLKDDPFSRRHIINMYQETDLRESKGLNPCAYETIWAVRRVQKDLVLDMTLVQRSQDFLMAAAINKIQYVSLQMMIASHLGYKIGRFCHYVHNLHIYDRHIDSAKELLTRTPLEQQPKMELLNNRDFYDFTIDDFKITGIEGIQKLSKKLEIAI